MRRIISILLSLVLFSALCACGNTNNSLPEAEEKKPIYKLEDSIETDILKITLNNAEFAIKMNSTRTGTYDEIKNGTAHPIPEYFTAEEFDPSQDLGEAYIAHKGHTYVAIQYLAENLDRASVDFDGSINEQFITVEYNGETFQSETKYGAVSEDGFEWEMYNSDTVLLLAGTKAYVRGYIDIPIDVADLKDDFDLIFSLPKSDGTTADYRYHISEADRTAIENAEISQDEAVAKFLDSEAQEFFTKYKDEYTVLTGEEIEEKIIGKSWTIKIKETNGTWEGKFMFESDGDILETIFDGSVGYFNSRYWKIDGDSLIIDGKHTCDVRSIKEDVYLLYDDELPYAVIKK